MNKVIAILLLVLLPFFTMGDTPPINYQFLTPLSRTGANVSIQKSDATHNGYLAAADFVLFSNPLPSQAGHNGEGLFTNGTSTFWAAVSGSGTVTNVTSTGGSIDITNPTTVPNLAIHFPMVVPQTGTAAAPSIRFDSDTGIYSTGDGVLDFTTNSILAFAINPSQQAFFTSSVTATDFVYPPKAIRNFLASPNSGAPGTPTFRSIQNGDISNAAIPYPLFAPQNPTFLGTGYCFDSDSCMDSSGDGEIQISNNSSLSLHLSQNQVDAYKTWNFHGDVNIDGNITAANYPPTGGAGTAAGFNALSSLASIPGWNFDTNTGSPNFYINKDMAGIGYTFFNLEAAGEVTADGGTNMVAFNGDFHFDRNNTGFNGDQMYGMNIGTRAEGSGHLNNLIGLDSYTQAGNGNGATVDTMEGGRIDTNIATGSTVNDTRGLTVSTDGSNGLTLNNAYMIGAFHSGVVGANLDIISTNHNNGAVAGNVNMFTGFYGNTSPIGQDFNGVNIGTDSTVGNNATGFHYFQSQNVARNFTGATVGVNGDLGQDGDNHLGYDINFGGGSTYNVRGNMFGFNMNNNDALISTNSRFNGVNINNGTGGTAGSFLGLGVYNQANMVDEKSGINMNLQGNSRTSTGLQISMQGVGIDDVQGLRINMSGQTSTSTTNHVHSLDIQGGAASIFGDYKPFPNVNVDIGNGYSITSTIDLGTPLVGTDQILQLIQSNLIVHDDINTGPFGLDTNMIGAVSQVAVDSGKTVPALRGLLLGTSVPQGSGGTIGKYVTLQLLGLPSFGGSVTNNIRYAIEDGSLLGQNYCDGATDCRFINVIDARAQIKSASGVTLSTSGAQPTCDVDHRGQLWNIEGGAGVADILQICQKDATDNYVWISK